MPVTKYDEIYASLRERIESGEIAFRAFLPSENRLMGEFGTTRTTVRKALQYLSSQGYVQSMQGRGIQVIYRPLPGSRVLLNEIEPLAAVGARMGKTVTTQLLSCQHSQVDEELAERSGLPVGEDILVLHRLRCMNGRPVILDLNHYLASIVPHIPRQAAETSICRYLENILRVRITSSARAVSVEPAAEQDRELLDLEGLDCVGVIDALNFDGMGHAFEFTQSRHVPATFSLTTTAQRLPSQR